MSVIRFVWSSGSQLSLQQGYRVRVDGLDELVAQLEDGQALALLLDGPHVAEPERGRLAQRLGLPLRHLEPAQPDAPQLLLLVSSTITSHAA